MENGENSTTAPTATEAPAPKPKPAPAPAKRHSLRRVIIIVVGIVAIIGGGFWIDYAINNVSTDDAYVNGHVTYVAARVPGQVTRVFVDDNNRVHKGDLLVQLDPEPYQVQVNIAKAAMDVAQAELVSANANARSIIGQARSLRFALDHAIEDVDNQIALLHSRVATLDSARATLVKAKADYDRGVPLVKQGALSKEDFDARTAALAVAQAEVDEALQGVYQVRVELGLTPEPPAGKGLADVPPDLDQTFSTVRQAQGSLIQAVSQLGYVDSFDLTPKQMIADFYNQDPSRNVDIIYGHLLKNAPTIKDAQAKLLAAQKNLDQALLNLRYCNVYAEIDGAIIRRDVNPGNNVVAGQSLMAIRSLTEIWIDANFKETQLRKLRIGQPADLDVDMYGSHEHFMGRITGFEMGTGSTLALLPPENATGNFVKVVQRLPVRIDLVDYDPDKSPLFVGLSVTPTVHVSEEATGQDAGKVLQPYLSDIPSTQALPESQP
jgi:membrane fusion protein (multidrug efflux system)